MKLPSIVRLPSSRSFSYEPRHYDPIKEEISERTSRIKREMEENGEIEKEAGVEKGYYSPTISFKRKQRSSSTATLIQMAIAAVLATLILGWLYYGNDVFYGLFVIFPVYAYFRFKGRFGKKG